MSVVEEENFGSVWRRHAEAHPEVLAIVQGESTLSWGEWFERARRIAGGFKDAGLEPGEHVGVALRNGFAIFEVYFACFLGGYVPVNTNYRYQSDELRYVWDNADVRLAVFDRDMSERVDAIRGELPDMLSWVCVDEEDGESPSWAVGLDEHRTGRPAELVARDGDDVFLLYTGGTTGLPKGAIWRQGDFFQVLHGTSRRRAGSSGADSGSAGGGGEEERSVAVVGPPLIHGTGMALAWGALDAGGTIVLLPGGRFDADEMVEAMCRHQASIVAIVGDAFGIPLADALARHGDKDVSSVKRIVSSGAIWSARNKVALAAAIPGARLVDMFGSSETVGVGRSVWKGQSSGDGPRFKVGDNVRIVTDEGAVVPVTPGARGRVAVGGPTALGYYNDEALSGQRFVEAGGERWFVTGDVVLVDGDGALRFLGRGNMCINTGGEKVYPEEVEIAIKAVDGVVDVGVVGAADERFGEIVCAVVDCGDAELDLATITGEVRGRLAGYKVPKQIFRGSVFRLANGKLDYSLLKEWVSAQVSKGE